MNLAVAGVFTWGIAAGLALADGLDATTQVSQAVEQYRTLAPRFGQPTVVTTSANTTAATLATQLRSVLNQRAPGTFQPAPAPLTASSPQTSPTATNLRQRDALARLSETTDSSLLIQLRPENQTIRQIRATDLLNPTLRSRARPAGGGAPAKESLARTFLNQHRAAFQLEDPDTELITVAVEDDLLGHTHVRFQQQHQGHEVALARLTAHFHPDGRLELLDGAYIPTPQDVPVAPTTGIEEDGPGSPAAGRDHGRGTSAQRAEAARRYGAVVAAPPVPPVPSSTPRWMAQPGWRGNLKSPWDWPRPGSSPWTRSTVES